MLNNYIDGAVDAVTVRRQRRERKCACRREKEREARSVPRPQLQDALIAGTVRRFAVLVLDQNGLVVERFVAALAVRPEILASVEPEDVEAALRSCLLKLQFLETSLEPLPAGASREERGREERRGEVGMAWARRVSSPHFERREAVGAALSPFSPFLPIHSLSSLSTQAAPLRSSPTPPTGRPCPSRPGWMPTRAGRAAPGWARTRTTACRAGKATARVMAGGVGGAGAAPHPARRRRRARAAPAGAALAAPPSCPSSPRPRAGARCRCRCTSRAVTAAG